MNIDEALAYLDAHIHYGTWAAKSARIGPFDLSLDRMRVLVDVLDHPELRVPMIHVSGTNGKGSTSRMITRILMADGLRVGTYSSPHLDRYNERFRIDDVDIDDVALAELLTEMAAAEREVGDELLPFELLTGAAFSLFARQAVDVAVLEVGVLGRFDATNVADGAVAVITNIGFDHTDGEGDWQWRIAEEKAGIVKPGAHVILGDVDKRLLAPFREPQPSELWRLGREITLERDEPVTDGRSITVSTPWQTVSDIDVPLFGAHQSRNCALAVAAASAFMERPLQPAHVVAGVASVRMPARLEMAITEPQVILDGAHNPDAARALASALHDDLPCEGRRILVIGVLGGRDPAAMLEAIDADAFDTIITCTPPTMRARHASELAAAATIFDAHVIECEHIHDALQTALASVGPDDQIVVTGSIYLVAEARAELARGRGREAAYPPVGDR